MKNPENDRLLRALNRQPVDRTPVWIMRQAGRYLPEYRAVRKTADFMTMCRTPELAAEVTLQPIRRYGMDAAILFSDILVVPDAMGCPLELIESKGPVFHSPIRSASDVHRLIQPDPDRDLSYVMNAIRLINRELYNSIPLIGFAGAPWTLFTYMVDGQATKTWRYSKSMLLDHPELADELLMKLANAVADYLLAQIAAGVHAVQLFETWAGALSPAMYRRFAWPALQHTLDRVKSSGVPVIGFAKGGFYLADELIAAGASAIGLDHSVSMEEARIVISGRAAVQGNLDPAVLYAKPDAIRQEVRAVLDGWGAAPGHVFNLGHGINPDVDPDHVAVLVDEVRTYSAQLLKGLAEKDLK